MFARCLTVISKNAYDVQSEVSNEVAVEASSTGRDEMRVSAWTGSHYLRLVSLHGQHTTQRPY